jgi:hypothetical protein
LARFQVYLRAHRGRWRTKVTLAHRIAEHAASFAHQWVLFVAVPPPSRAVCPDHQLALTVLPPVPLELLHRGLFKLHLLNRIILKSERMNVVIDCGSRLKFF